MAKERRFFRVSMLPLAVIQAIFMLFLAGIWLWIFGLFWTFMVLELPKDLGPYSQMSSLSMFLHRAFPMGETGDTQWQFKFDHVLILAIVMTALTMSWAPTRSEVDELFESDSDKKAAKKTKAKKLDKARNTDKDA
eukprot:TRINITY_DN23264_c0_g1_i1.p1 TRINITY_DN23264_c0_g1~~TRINITY_DN23264_c0_g1_i1.p1  ORF type:complete len:136 (+),score=30.97 TRINITY_DN23264_c0_g1_i1:50-457(+)